MGYAPQQLVAHRGWPLRYPENTLLGIQAAIARGAVWIEFDVQLTRDRVPVLYHDLSLQRGCGDKALITELSFEALPQNASSFPERYGEKFAGCGVDSLEALVEVLNAEPQVRAFVELKTESAEIAGHELFYRTVNTVLERLNDRSSVAAIISKDASLCDLARADDWPIGLVLHERSEQQLQETRSRKPDYVFSNVRRLPDDPAQMLPGDWIRVGYTINEASAIQRWLDYGLDIIETDNIDLLADIG